MILHLGTYTCALRTMLVHVPCWVVMGHAVWPKFVVHLVLEVALHNSLQYHRDVYLKYKYMMHWDPNLGSF